MKTQTRGNCQCCGRDQAVLSYGTMSKHGYTVDHGWFNGVCNGEHFKPLQVDRSVADHTIAAVLEECKSIEATLDDLKSGKIHPAEGTIYCASKQVLPWAELSPYRQRELAEGQYYRAQSRVRAGRAFAGGLKELADRLHGTPLRTVEKAAAPEPILPGEQRISKSGQMLFTFLRFDRARVVYSYRPIDGSGRAAQSYTSTRMWRTYKKKV
jgi:hypothetical protein